MGAKDQDDGLWGLIQESLSMLLSLDQKRYSILVSRLMGNQVEAGWMERGIAGISKAKKWEI